MEAALSGGWRFIRAIPVPRHHVSIVTHVWLWYAMPRESSTTPKAFESEKHDVLLLDFPNRGTDRD
ncbi:MAG: hypothetical protein JNL67_00505 [Planctomycetaceae bacterium]|nr:hypothetical protein [Planctomycetaceae bacterium]